MKTVFSPQRRMATPMEARAPVKFRLTGTRPEMSVAAFISAAPTEAGIIMPTIFCPRQRRSIQRESISAPASDRPQVSSCPVESAMHSRRHANGRRPRRAPELDVQRKLEPLPQREGVRPEVQHRAAHLRAELSGGSGAPERHRHRPRNPLRPLEEIAPALEAEDAAPKPVHVHRRDRRARPARDQLEAALEAVHVAGARHAAFREQADDLARLERRDDVRDGCLDRLGRIVLGHRDRPERPHQRPGEPARRRTSARSGTAAAAPARSRG